MACTNCGRRASDHHRRIYTTASGWLDCEYREGTAVPAPAIHIRGRATYLKMYDETKAFRDRAVHDAEAKARKVR